MPTKEVVDTQIGGNILPPPPYTAQNIHEQNYLPHWGSQPTPRSLEEGVTFDSYPRGFWSSFSRCLGIGSRPIVPPNRRAIENKAISEACCKDKTTLNGPDLPESHPSETRPSATAVPDVYSHHHGAPGTFTIHDSTGDVEYFPISDRSALPRRLEGFFVGEYTTTTREDKDEDCKGSDVWGEQYKYRVCSFHCPKDHQYAERGANSPWFADITLTFNNLDVLKNLNLHWRDLLEHRYRDETTVDFSAHPVIKEFAMYKRYLKLEFMEYEAQEGHEEGYNEWSVQITVWARSSDWVEGLEERDIVDLFNEDTMVRLEGFRTKDTDDPLCIPSRAYIKFPAALMALPPGIEQIGSVVTRDQHESFCVDVLDNEIEMDDPELCRTVEENFERQLFG